MINACSRVPQWWIFLKVKHNSYKLQHILVGGGLGFNLIVGLETELHLWFKIRSLLWWMPDSVATRLEWVEVTQAEASSMAAESLQAVPWGLKALGLAWDACPLTFTCASVTTVQTRDKTFYWQLVRHTYNPINTNEVHVQQMRFTWGSEFTH